MRQFVAVAEELHFGRAASRLNMAQPPLSQAIRRLELDLGVDLFNRSRRNVELTDAGRVFLVEARRTLLQAGVARKMAQSAAADRPEVRISFIGPALYQVLPAILVGFRATAPNTHARLFESPSPQQVSGILAGDYHVGFITDGIPHGGCESMLVERSRFVAAVPASSPLGKRRAVSLAELATQPFILPPQKYAEHSETMNLFKNAGVVPRVEQEASQTATTLSLVSAGLGCSVVMATAALQSTHNVRFLHIEDDLPHARWEMAMIWRPEHLSPQTAQFLEFVERHLKENPDLLDVDSYRTWLQRKPTRQQE
jgi:DNA-binding transcriptional LysR family regulator